VAVPHSNSQRVSVNFKRPFVPTMSSSVASTSKPEESLTKINEKTKEEDTQPTLGVLEEDDEFEEFAVAGQ
jgi:hypothetical protein